MNGNHTTLFNPYVTSGEAPSAIRSKPMKPLSLNASDADLIAFADGWAELMEAEDYEAAFAYTEHTPEMGWTPVLIREVVKGYGDAEPNQKVTLFGKPTDIVQRKNVRRHEPNRFNFIGEIWYDLNINGYASDLTATFDLKLTAEGILAYLNDIHVM